MLNKEPALIIGSVSEILRAIPSALIVFSVWNPTNDQQLPTVLLFVGLFIGLLEKLFIRRSVVPTTIANEQIQLGIDAPKGSTTVERVIEAHKEKENAEIVENI